MSPMHRTSKLSLIFNSTRNKNSQISLALHYIVSADATHKILSRPHTIAFSISTNNVTIDIAKSPSTPHGNFDYPVFSLDFL